VEDQSTDTSSLTEAGAGTPDDDAQPVAATPATAATPVGKRGRHRSFRPRAVSAQEEARPEITETTAVEPESTVEPETATVESTQTAPADAESSPLESAVVEDADAKPAKRRRWFRARTAKPVTEDEPAAQAEAAEPAQFETTKDDGAESEDSETADDEVKAVERKPVGRRLAVVVAVAAALFVAAGAFGGAMLQPYLADRATAATKIQVARTATDAVNTMFTYTPTDVEQLSARSAKYLGGDFRDAYTKQVDALAPANKQSQIHRSAQVVGAAIESLNGDNAIAMVYVNISYTSAQTKDLPRIYLIAYRLTMERKRGDWLITSMPWVTSKDLTRV
jgi:Mce-associated membrane protein